MDKINLLIIDSQCFASIDSAAIQDRVECCRVSVSDEGPDEGRGSRQRVATVLSATQDPPKTLTQVLITLSSTAALKRVCYACR